MPTPSYQSRPKASRAGLLLLALLLFRAYIPVGFMPASGVPFALQLCPAGTEMPAHLHHHAGGHGDFESCPFGSAPGAAPISQHIDFQTPGPAPSLRMASPKTPLLVHRSQSTHQPRGPPSLA
jgi:hypothetical protein